MKKNKNNWDRKWDTRAIIGLCLLLLSFLMGAVLKNSAQIASGTQPKGFTGFCDTYITGLCIPTFYIDIPLESNIWLVINFTSFLTSLILFVAGVILVRE